MALFGCDIENNYAPFHGCTTFRTDLDLGRIPGHMALTLAELVRATFYRGIKEADIQIVSRPLKGAYIASTGEYVGSGINVYTLYFESEDTYYEHTVRATDRKALRDALKLLYPYCKISR